jgi:hypothetical protein
VNESIDMNDDLVLATITSAWSGKIEVIVILAIMSAFLLMPDADSSRIASFSSHANDF